MNVIKPALVSPAMLVSSNATETYAAWSAATAYAQTARVVRSTTNRIYERMVTGTTATAPESDAANWFDYGPSNKFAMFDEQVSTVTSAAGVLTVTVATGIIDSVALIGVNADSARLTLRDGLGGPVIYDSTVGLNGDLVGDWYQYFFSDPLIRRTQSVFQGLPPYGSSHLTLTLTGGGLVSLGNLVFGRKYALGDAEFGATAGLVDYSRKTTDAFGVTTFVRREFSKRLTARLRIDNLQLNRVQRTLYSLRATPCVWLASDAPEFNEPLVVYGFYKDFSTSIAYARVSFCSLEIEGLI